MRYADQSSGTVGLSGGRDSDWIVSHTHWMKRGNPQRSPPEEREQCCQAQAYQLNTPYHVRGDTGFQAWKRSQRETGSRLDTDKLPNGELPHNAKAKCSWCFLLHRQPQPNGPGLKMNNTPSCVHQRATFFRHRPPSRNTPLLEKTTFSKRPSVAALALIQ